MKHIKWCTEEMYFDEVLVSYEVSALFTKVPWMTSSTTSLKKSVLTTNYPNFNRLLCTVTNKTQCSASMATSTNKSTDAVWGILYLLSISSLISSWLNWNQLLSNPLTHHSLIGILLIIVSQMVLSLMVTLFLSCRKPEYLCGARDRVRAYSGFTLFQRPGLSSG